MMGVEDLNEIELRIEHLEKYIQGTLIRQEEVENNSIILRLKQVTTQIQAFLEANEPFNTFIEKCFHYRFYY